MHQILEMRIYSKFYVWLLDVVNALSIVSQSVSLCNLAQLLLTGMLNVMYYTCVCLCVQPIEQLQAARQQLLAAHRKAVARQQQREEQRQLWGSHRFKRIAAEVSPTNAFESSTLKYFVKG